MASAAAAGAAAAAAPSTTQIVSMRDKGWDGYIYCYQAPLDLVSPSDHVVVQVGLARVTDAIPDVESSVGEPLHGDMVKRSDCHAATAKNLRRRLQQHDDGWKSVTGTRPTPLRALPTWLQVDQNADKLIEVLKEPDFSRVLFVVRRSGDSAHIEDSETLLRSHLGIRLPFSTFGKPLLDHAQLYGAWVPKFGEGGKLTNRPDISYTELIVLPKHVAEHLRESFCEPTFNSRSNVWGLRQFQHFNTQNVTNHAARAMLRVQLGGGRRIAAPIITYIWRNELRPFPGKDIGFEEDDDCLDVEFASPTSTVMVVAGANGKATEKRELPMSDLICPVRLSGCLDSVPPTTGCPISDSGPIPCPKCDLTSEQCSWCEDWEETDTSHVLEVDQEDLYLCTKCLTCHICGRVAVSACGDCNNLICKDCALGEAATCTGCYEGIEVADGYDQTCPECSEPRALFRGDGTGMWDCKQCGEIGPGSTTSDDSRASGEMETEDEVGMMDE
eukprot:m.28978 g.28978  ORF g.28978 m.28978 type:complete len:500 (-) comp12067_c0_seq1:98-1597(-)